MFQRQWLLHGLAVSFFLLGGCAMDTASPAGSAPIEDINRPQHHTHHSTSAATTTQALDTDTTNSNIAPAQPDLPPQPVKNPAAATLLNEAAQARAQGDNGRAQTLAERAQTIAPQEARTYLELSRIYAQRGDSAHAKQMAVRGLSVVHDDPTTERDLQQMSAP